MEQDPDSPPPSFRPVPVRARRDGWTPERQQAFIAALRECRCVRTACRRVGKSPEAAYELARRPGAEGFRGAWRAALERREPSRLSTSGRKVQPSSLPSTSGRRLPAGRQLPARPDLAPTQPQPAYSLEAFKAMVRQGRLRRAKVDGRGDFPRDVV